MTNQEFIESITLDGEVWKPVTGFENLYCISSFGRVVSLEKYVSNRFQNVRKEPRLLIPHDNGGGNLSVLLSNNGKSVKRHLSALTAFEFLPNPNNYPVLEHLDGDISNNRVDNLMWRPIKDRRKQHDTSSLEGEEWKDVPGYEGIYKISSLGRVLSSYSRKILVPCYSGKKPKQYYAVTLAKDGIKTRYYIHKLVALAFIPNPNGYTDIDHINTNKEENTVTNLRWCSQSMNMNNPLTRAKIAKFNATIGKKGIKHKQVVQLKNGELIRTFRTASEAARHGFEHTCIRNCCKGISKLHHGFQWMYKEDYDNLLSKMSKNSLLSQ